MSLEQELAYQPHEGVGQFQEVHSPTKVIVSKQTIRSDQNGTVYRQQFSICRRRIEDADIDDLLNTVGEQVNKRFGRDSVFDPVIAAEKIRAAFVIVSGQLGYATLDLLRARGAKTSLTDGQTELVAHYLDWADSMKRHRVSLSMFLKIIVEGKSLRQADKESCKRKGTARSVLARGMELWDSPF